MCFKTICVMKNLLINKISFLFLFSIFSSIVFCQTNSADLEIYITSPNNGDIINVGQTETYTIFIKNNGPNTAENVVCTIGGGDNFNQLSSSTVTGTFINNVWAVGNILNEEIVALTITNIMNSYCNGTHLIGHHVTSSTNDNNLLNNWKSIHDFWDPEVDFDLQCVSYNDVLTNGDTINLNYNFNNFGFSEACVDIIFSSVGLSIINCSATEGTWNNQTKIYQVSSKINHNYSIQLECLVIDSQNTSLSGFCQANSLAFEYILNNNSCSTVFSNLATNQNQFKDAIQISPNPVYDRLNVTISDEIVKSIALFDILGKKIIEISNNFDHIDVSNLQQGLYLLKIETANKRFFCSLKYQLFYLNLRIFAKVFNTNKICH